MADENSTGSYSATVRIHGAAPIATIPPGIYGQYLEHVQIEEETIYPAVWDKSRGGVRTDVAAAARTMGVPVIRWPGGCFADNYHWEDGIGPQEQRPERPNVHWGGIEPNNFGTDEFLRWCHLTASEPYINVNLGSGSLDEALRWLEYCNGAADTVQGARRADNGHPKPYDVKYWGIGNETWGEWETGHTDADTYGTSLSLWARAMRAKDPSVRILGVGSEEGNDRAWDTTVLKKAGGDIDLLTVHMYGVSTSYDGSEYEAFVFTPVYLENRLQRMLETVDSVTTTAVVPGTIPRKTPLNLSIDEWNIRHFFDGKQNRKSPRNLQDAIFTAGLFNAMIRLSPRVEMANYVFLINGNGALLVKGDQIVKTPLSMVFHQYGEWMQGEALDVRIDAPELIPPPPLTAHPGRKAPADYVAAPAPWLDAAAARQTTGSLAISLVNRHPDQAARVSLQLPPDTILRSKWMLTSDNIYAANSFENPDRVIPHFTQIPPVDPTMTVVVTVPAHSIMLLQGGAK